MKKLQYRHGEKIYTIKGSVISKDELFLTFKDNMKDKEVMIPMANVILIEEAD